MIENNIEFLNDIRGLINTDDSTLLVSFYSKYNGEHICSCNQIIIIKRITNILVPMKKILNLNVICQNDTQNMNYLRKICLNF